MTPQKISMSYPHNLTWQRDLVYVIKLRVLKWADYPGLSRLPLNVITRVLKRGRRIRANSMRCDDISKRLVLFVGGVMTKRLQMAFRS